jgi:hypothetical protein
MPQDKLEQALLSRGMLQRPPRQEGERVPLKQIPWKDEDSLTRFVGGFSGMDEPGGGAAGLLGAVAGTANPLDDILRYVKGVKGTGRMAEFASVDDPRSISKFADHTPLPQVEDAFQKSGKYKPEVSSEMGRLIGEMIPHKGVKAGWQEFAKINPEAAGHVRQLTLGSDAGKHRTGGLISGRIGNMLERLNDAGGHYSNVNVPTLAEKEWAGEIYVNPNSLSRFIPRGNADTTAHELQHHAQQMLEGRRQFNENYRKMAKQFGYQKNPYEVEARKVGADIANKVKINKISGR